MIVWSVNSITSCREYGGFMLRSRLDGKGSNMMKMLWVGEIWNETEVNMNFIASCGDLTPFRIYSNGKNRTEFMDHSVQGNKLNYLKTFGVFPKLIGTIFKHFNYFTYWLWTVLDGTKLY